MGASITLSDTEMREVDLAAWPSASQGNDVREALQDQDFRLRHAVRGGDVLARALVEPLPAVTRGDWVRLQTNEGAVSLESRAEALQDGRAGQVVNVRLANARSSILARVRGPGLVEVQQ
jgi:flagella basal body P-ring formation protein FlgA